MKHVTDVLLTPELRATFVKRSPLYLGARILGLCRALYAERLERAHERRVRRQTLIRQLAELCERGEVAVIESGRDCDGMMYDGKVHYIDANTAAFDRLCGDTARWADGPFSFRLMRPSEAERVTYASRDLALEAFEDGHAHVLRP